MLHRKGGKQTHDLLIGGWETFFWKQEHSKEGKQTHDHFEKKETRMLKMDGNQPRGLDDWRIGDLLPETRAPRRDMGDFWAGVSGDK